MSRYTSPSSCFMLFPYCIVIYKVSSRKLQINTKITSSFRLYLYSFRIAALSVCHDIDASFAILLVEILSESKLNYACEYPFVPGFENRLGTTQFRICIF